MSLLLHILQHSAYPINRLAYVLCMNTFNSSCCFSTYSIKIWQQVIVQGWLLTVDNVQRLIDIVQRHLYDVEKHLAESVASASNGNGLTRTLASRQVSCYHYMSIIRLKLSNAFVFLRKVSYERTMEYSYEDELDTVNEGIHKRLPLTSPDTSFVNLIRYGILALQLLPDNTSAG